MNGKSSAMNRRENMKQGLNTLPMSEQKRNCLHPTANCHRFYLNLSLKKYFSRLDKSVSIAVVGNNVITSLIAKMACISMSELILPNKVKNVNGNCSKKLEESNEHNNMYVCLWNSCLKYRKEGKPFPSLPRLLRHVKEKHLPSAIRLMFPNQRAK